MGPSPHSSSRQTIWGRVALEVMRVGMMVINGDFHVTLDETVALVEYHSRDKATPKQASMPWFSSGELHGVSVFLRDGDSI
jgi:hypothetical protein